MGRWLMGGFVVFLIKISALSVTLALALYYDLRFRKIKNYITFPAAACGCLLNLWESGFSGLLFSLKGIAFPIMVLFFLYAINVMGAGDIKLFAALGAIMGWSFTFSGIIFSILFGALIATFLLVKRRNFVPKMLKVFNYLYVCLATKRLVTYSGKEDTNSKFAFSLAIVPGVLTQIFLTYQGFQI